ncbi:MAG TPA: glutamate racemase [Terriglobales bacterium]|nr:glutamate racemase [Terriglobales bacterium]
MAKLPVIGVFDSGVGGLTVLRALMERVPQADYLYFGDTARLPYGSKSVQTIAKYAISAAQYLQSHGAEYVVVACNTASALALDAMASAIEVEVLGVIEPGAQVAAAASKSRRAVVIATEGTVGSHAYRRALERHGISATEKACPLFVPLVEEGWTDHEVTERVARIYLDALFAPDAQVAGAAQSVGAGADTLVLGCTHYPLLKPLLRRVVPASVAIVDSAEATAEVVAAKFEAATSGAASGSASVRFFATDSVEKFRRAGEKFLGRSIEGVEHVEIE